LAHEGKAAVVVVDLPWPGSRLLLLFALPFEAAGLPSGLVVLVRDPRGERTGDCGRSPLYRLFCGPTALIHAKTTIVSKQISSVADINLPDLRLIRMMPAIAIWVLNVG